MDTWQNVNYTCTQMAKKVGTGRHRRNILIVEDDPKIVELLSLHLRDINFEIDSASEGNAGLSRALEGRNSLIILDIMLPVMNGYQLLEHLKADHSLSHIPVIIATSLDEADEKAKCLALGAEDYLTKPFNPVVLKNRISDCLARHYGVRP